MLFRDESKTWVNAGDVPRLIDDGRAFLWVSERDGWRHVYRVPRQGGAGTLVTHFNADISDLVGIDEAHGWLYVVASPDNATERYLYRAKLDGTDTPERITPAADRGTHGYNISPDGQVAIHTFSTFDRPTKTDMISLPDHRRLRNLTDTGVVEERVAAAVSRPAEFFQIGVGDGVTLDGYLLKPATFDPGKRYPIIFHVYGEAASQTAANRWYGSEMLFHRALAEQGYLIASVDNRGTPTLKGADFRKVVYGAVGELSSKEQAAAVAAIAAKYPFVDRDRVGIWGWSGGGSSTLNAMFRYPDVYKVGVAVAPVPDQKLYDTIYQERYMGLPQDNADGYRRGSPITFAEGLKGDLLVVHGTGDDNVHFQGTETLINRLVALGKRFDVMVYPNRTHGISEGPGTTVHVYKKIAHYFLDHLSPGPR
jgi:dipeptidyl-peptidase 4